MSSERRIPIGVFAYNRPENLRLALESLGRCDGYDDFDLHIYCDAPKTPKVAPSVRAARAVAREWVEVHGGRLIERERNLRFKNIVNGVTELCERHGRVVVVEDDLVVSPDFLTYMRRGLDKYEDEPKVWAVSGFMYPVEHECAADAFFLSIFLCWGWATWKRAWDSFTWEPEGWQELLADEGLRKRFDVGGSYAFSSMLKRAMEGSLETWDIQYYFIMFWSGGLSLVPRQSLTWNTGVGQGVHSAGGSRVDARVDFIHGRMNRSEFLKPRLGRASELPDRVELDDEAYRRLSKHLAMARPSLPWRALRRLLRCVGRIWHRI